MPLQGHFFLPIMIYINPGKFVKAHISFDEQVKQIKDKFENWDEADDRELKSLIHTHGFYRLKGYIKPFLRQKVRKKFCCVNILTIKNVIEIDLLLRGCLLSNILVIENMITLRISEKMCRDKGPYWYMDRNLFTSSTLSVADATKKHDEIVSKVRFDTQLKDDQHPHPGVVSYAKKHDPDHMPSWIVRECVSFGTWVQIFDSMSNDIKLSISGSFAFKKYNSKSRFSVTPNAFASWVRSISILRNVCAHNGIVVNKIFSHPPSPHESVPAIKNTPGPNILDRLKVMECFLSFISDDESVKFINDVKSIIYKHEASGVDGSVVKKIFGFDKADL